MLNCIRRYPNPDLRMDKIDIRILQLRMEFRRSFMIPYFIKKTLNHENVYIPWKSVNHVLFFMHHENIFFHRLHVILLLDRDLDPDP
jgi:hypothetical protein